jgi:5-methylcytosine-specific restriction endonuclease McrA
MSGSMISKYVTPWKFRRAQEAQRLQAVRLRDGDNCSRCRRPMRFDLPRGHDLGAKVEQVVPANAGGSEAVDNLVLCHGRCNSESADNTPEVMERIRRKNEAALLSRSRQKRSA